MLLDITLENYRSVKERQTVSFEAVTDNSLDADQKIAIDERIDLIKIAAVVGPNGSGKSGVLRAVEAARAFVLAEESDTNPLNVMTGTAFAFDRDWASQPSRIELRAVIGIDEETGLARIYRYTLHADREKVHYEALFIQIGRSTRRFFERTLKPGEKKADGSPVYAFLWGKKYEGDKKKLGKRVPANRSFLQAAALKGGASVLPMYQWFRDRVDVIPLGLSAVSERMIIDTLKQYPGWRRKVVDFLWCMDLMDIRDLRIIEREGSSRLVYIHGAGDNRFASYFTSESLGVRRLTLISLMFMKAFIDSKTIISDDFSLFLHPGITTHLIQTFIRSSADTQSQMLISGVDITLMDDTLLRRDGIWFTTRGHSGGSVYYSLSDYKYRSKHVVSQMYRNGAFGALPILSDFIFENDKEI